VRESGRARARGGRREHKPPELDDEIVEPRRFLAPDQSFQQLLLDQLLRIGVVERFEDGVGRLQQVVLVLVGPLLWPDRLLLM
jgi:hypothetical protein